MILSMDILLLNSSNRLFFFAKSKPVPDLVHPGLEIVDHRLQFRNFHQNPFSNLRFMISHLRPVWDRCTEPVKAQAASGVNRKQQIVDGEAYTTSIPYMQPDDPRFPHDGSRRAHKSGKPKYG